MLRFLPPTPEAVRVLDNPPPAAGRGLRGRNAAQPAAVKRHSMKERIGMSHGPAQVVWSTCQAAEPRPPALPNHMMAGPAPEGRQPPVFE